MLHLSVAIVVPVKLETKVLAVSGFELRLFVNWTYPRYSQKRLAQTKTQIMLHM